MAEQGGGSSVWLWVGIGCGGLLLIFACFGGIGAYFFLQAKEASEEMAVAAREAEARYAREAAEAEQRAMMEREAALAQQGQGQGLGLPSMPPPPLPTGPRPTNTSPITVTAQVTGVTGNPGVSPGTPCTFLVEQHDAAERPGGYWCRANVMCGLTLLYGGGTAGYFPCTVTDSPRSVVGRDSDTTQSDSDGSLDIDTRAGRLRVADDATGRLGAFSVDAQITSAI